MLNKNWGIFSWCYNSNCEEEEKTKIITKLELCQTQIVTTQIVLKTQIGTKLSIGQNLNKDPSDFKRTPRNLKLQNN